VNIDEEGGRPELGTDIYGYLEVRWPDDRTWHAISSMPKLLCVLGIPDRDYDAWGCLFGVRNRTGLQPLAASRGIPTDASIFVHQEFSPPEERSPGYHSPTWADLAEIDRMDYDEEIPRLSLAVPSIPNRRVQYLPASRPPGIADATWKALEQGEEADVANFPGFSVDVRLRMVSLTRGVAVSNYLPLFAVMRSMIDSCGGKENVRLVVWFDD